MKEFKAIVNACRKVDFSKQKAALATVVKVHGSSYRSPGARMLITDDGKWVGSISGGCLEGDALRKARQVMTTNIPLKVTYDTREESSQYLGIGLGCNGVIDVLIEPVTPGDKQNPIKLFEKFVATKAPVSLATVFSSPKENGQKLLCSHEGELHSTFSVTTLKELVRCDLTKLFSTPHSEAKCYDIEGVRFEVFIEFIQPSLSLIIFGGGFDARPVCQLAKSVGWEVTVTDECVAHIAPVFFPAADRLSLCARTFIDRDMEITPYTACVLMSHNYEYDRDVLKKLLPSQAPYIGILGPRKRFEKMREELEKGNIKITHEDMHRIHSPIGLDIGAEAPDEIALAIIAEIQGKFANRSGGFLKYRNSPIHNRDLKSDQVFKQVYLSQQSGSISGAMP